MEALAGASEAGARGRVEIEPKNQLLEGDWSFDGVRVKSGATSPASSIFLTLSKKASCSGWIANPNMNRYPVPLLDSDPR
jgi:hypothetical protein